MSQYAHLSTPHHEIAELIANLPSFPLSGDIKTDRQLMSGVLSAISAELYKGDHLSESAYRVVDHSVPVEAGEILVRALTPTSEPGQEGQTFPLMLWIHGGSWSFGSIDVDDHALRHLCVELRVSILNVGYRLAPEFPFPAGLNDCYAAMKWAVTNCSLLSASLTDGFIVAGSSAGGNLAAALAHRARDDQIFAETPLTGAWLQIPALMHPDGVPEKYKSELLSMEQNKNAPILSVEHLRVALNWLNAPPADPEFSVLLADHKGLPPTYIQVFGLDPLRDEALLYEKLLKEEGVKTKLDVYPGLPHAGHVVFGTLTISHKVKEDASVGVKWLLHGNR